jgi:hypothetical protein
MRTLHIVVRDPDGRMGDQAIGQAIVAAAIDEKVTKSALRKSLLALAFYQAHSPRQAAEAMRTLAELGDVTSRRAISTQSGSSQPSASLRLMCCSSTEAAVSLGLFTRNSFGFVKR